MNIKNKYSNLPEKRQKQVIYAAVIAAAFLSFISIYGISIINPAYYDWMFANGDTIQHIVGAEGFRKSPWFFPIGNMNTLNYPHNVSVIFYDAIPIFAVIAKICTRFLPQHFQYFGIWGLICFILQGVISAKIIQKYTKSFWIILISSILFIHSPIMIYRIFNHEALGAQWLILLASLLLIEYDNKYCNLKSSMKLVGFLGLLTPGIHIYFVLLCGIVIAGYCLYDLMQTKKISRTILILLNYCICVLFITFVLGGFSMNTIGSGGLGVFSLNLNSLINNMDQSVFVKSLPMNLGQTEGFSYLGIGQICLIITVTILHFTECRGKIKTDRKLLFSCVFISVICVLLAVSQIVTLGTRTLFSIPLPGIVKKILSTFRSTGRIIWPFYYLLILYAVITGIRILKPKTIFTFLLACFLIQRIELAPLYSKNLDNIVYESALQTEVWKKTAEDARIKNIVILGNSQGTKTPFYRLGIFAMENELTMNRFRMVHDNLDKAFDYYAQADQDIRDGSEDNLYVFLNDLDTISFPELNYYELDDYVIGINKNAAQPDLPEFTQNTFKIPFNRFSISKGENLNGIRCLYENGELSGPKQILREGKYLLTINGESLESCQYTAYSEENPDAVHYETVKSDNVQVQIQVEIAQNLDDFEFKIVNPSEEMVKISLITIEALA